MRTLALMLILSLMTFLVAPETVWASDARVKSYKEWKTERIQQAQERLVALKIHRDPNLKRGKGLEGREPDSQRLEAQVRREQNALESARELTVSDYFAGYLIRLSNKNTAFKEAAGKLSPDEVAELMAAYANSVFGTQPAAGLPANAFRANGDVK